MFIAESVSEKNLFLLVNIWQSYKQKCDCLVHFLHLLAVCWPGAQSQGQEFVLRGAVPSPLPSSPLPLRSRVPP